MAIPYNVKKRLTMCDRTTTYLSRANDTIFSPRGLFAMVVTFRPESASKTVSVNTSCSPLDSIRQYGTSRVSQTGSGGADDQDTTHGAAELPPSAPLVFPTAEEMSTQNTKGFKRTWDVATDYFDRRARASYVSLPHG